MAHAADLLSERLLPRPPLTVLDTWRPAERSGARESAEGSRPTRPELALIPAGPFLMGSDADSDAERPVHEVYVDSFLCSRHAVTQVMFGEFLADVAEAATDVDLLGLAREDLEEYRAWHRRDQARDRATDHHPAVNLSWHDAERYARWLSVRTGEPFRLPTEAEWEKAARGGTVQGSFPWGDEDAERMGANFGRPVVVGAAGTRSVFDVPRNGFGLFIGGNCWEWVSDWYDPAYYAATVGARDPKGPDSGVFKVRRGGAYNNRQAFRLRVASRNRLEPHLRFPNMGVRLVRPVLPTDAREWTFAGSGASAPAAVDPAEWSRTAREWERKIESALRGSDVLRARVEAVLDVLRPSMEIDRGGVVVEALERGCVRLRMVGTCHCCPKSSMTFADIAATLRRHIPELTEVERVEDGPHRSC